MENGRQKLLEPRDRRNVADKEEEGRKGPQQGVVHCPQHRPFPQEEKNQHQCRYRPRWHCPEEAQQAQAAAQQAQEEAAARQNPQRKEYWAEQWRSYGQQLDEAKRNGAPQETLYELEAQRGEAYQNYMRLSGQETVARSEQQARQKELAQQAQAQAQQQAPQAGQGSSEIEAAIQQTGQALTDVRLKIADLRAAGAEYAPGGGYSEPFQAALDEEARLESQLDAQQAQAYQQAQASVNWGTLWGWASPDYEMTDAQKAVAAELVEQWNGTIGPKFDEYYETAQRLHALGQSTETVEMLLLQAEIMDALATKVSGVRSAFSGAGNALPLAPQVRGALEAENWRRAGFEGENPLGVAQRSQGAATQNPLAYHAGYLASGMGQYAAGSAAMKALPGVGRVLDDVAGALSGTQAMQKLQTAPVLGQLGTRQALAGMMGDSMLDLALSTIPKGMGLEMEYARQQREGLRPGETPLTQSGIFLQLAADAGLNAASGALGELAPAALGALDSVLHGQPVLNAAQQQGFEALRQGMAPSANQQAELHSLWGEAPGYVPVQQGGWDEFLSAPAAAGTAQDAAEAARRQAFAKWMQGEAMTPQETRLVNELWNTDPAKASEYWAAGQFLNTGAPTEIYEVLPLDKGNVDNDRKSWRQSEIDVGNLYPEYQAQKSFIGGREVPYGTKGSSRPDYYKTGYSIEVKNYTVSTVRGKNALIKNVVNQVNLRGKQLPKGTVQAIIIDVRGQNISNTMMKTLSQSILEKCADSVIIKYIK